MPDLSTNSASSWLSRTLAHWSSRVLPISPSPRFSRGEGRGEGRPPTPPITKSHPAPYFAFDRLAAPAWAPRDYTAFAREGFMGNAILYRSVRMIAEAAGSVPLLLYAGDEEIAEHPLLSLLARPNATATGPDLLEALYGYLLISGNAYLEALPLGQDIRELHTLRPDRMKVVPGAGGWPEAYDYTVDNKTRRLAAEAVSGVRRVLHLKLFHPLNDHYGLSPIEAAATAVDIHNTASRWNKALLDNSARPSGALVYTARDGNLTADQYDRLKAELEQGFQGAARAGRPLLLEGGLDWKSMSMSPKDMDFIEAKHVAAREIALAVGVPPMLLGIPGDNTYSNYQEATRSFWRSTVLPLVTRTAKSLSAWLAPAYANLPLPVLHGERAGVRGGQGLVSGNRFDASLELRPDLDSIEALSIEREALWTRIDKATFLTANEKRTAVGYGPITGGDELKASDTAGLALIDAPDPKANFNPAQPRDEVGRWTGEGGEDGGNDLVHQVVRRPGPWQTRPSTSGPPKPGHEVPVLPPPIPMIPRSPGTPAPAAPVPIPPGATIRNQAWAGGRHPDTGIPFNGQGFPIYDSVATHTVRIPHTGTASDVRAANRAAGFSTTPHGMVWHHHQDGYTMQLVPEEVHRRTGHTGSRGIGNLPGRKE
jgi:HK97 family phage portal protein